MPDLKNISEFFNKPKYYIGPYKNSPEYTKIEYDFINKIFIVDDQKTCGYSYGGKFGNTLYIQLDSKHSISLYDGDKCWIL